MFDFSRFRLHVIRAERRTIQLRVDADTISLRVPTQMTDAEIERFLREHADWIEKHSAAAAKESTAAQQAGYLTLEEIRELARRAMEVIPERVQYYAPLVGVEFGRITIRNQRSRWGSCSAKGNLNFNCLLMLAPPEVLDSVVVHELCHRKVRDHSSAFYAEVLRVFPDYWACDKWLRTHGPTLMKRMTG